MLLILNILKYLHLFILLQVINKNSKPHIQVDTKDGEKVFAAEEISSMVLQKMKEVAEAFLGTKVTHAVVTVPAVSDYISIVTFSKSAVIDHFSFLFSPL